ncbi:MAG TPA: PAN domain-containing protein [Thermoanaerobaculia bacterium]|nr:PAN domain-containing protein [Thermoanaerobaculia bacterium]
MTRRKKLGWTVLTLAATMAAQAWAQRVTIENGVNRKGNDYTNFRTRELEECRRACARDRRCQAYTYNHSDELCYLKDRVPGISRDSHTTAGVKEGGESGGWSGDLSEERGIDYRGGYYSRYQSRGLSSCKSDCRRDDRCVSYTFDVRDGHCSLEDKIGKRERDEDKVSGIKERGGSNPGGPVYGDLTEERGIDYRGGYYTRYASRGLASCKADCRRDDRCVSYTFDVRDGLCSLEDKIGKRERDDDKVSGIKRRP